MNWLWLGAIIFHHVNPYIEIATAISDMEADAVLDPCDEFDIFVLPYVFIPRIIQSLHQFASASDEDRKPFFLFFFFDPIIYS